MTMTDDMMKTLRNPTPLYAVAGTADLAAEKLREVPGLIEKLRVQAPEQFEKLRGTDPKVVQERVTTQAKGAQSRLNETISGFDLDLKKLGESVQDLALQSVGRAAEYAVKARETYDDLAVRGKGAVAGWRGEAADEVVEIAAVVEPKPAPKAQKAAPKATPKAADPAKKSPAARKAAPKKDDK
jgi:hypothetical protein